MIFTIKDSIWVIFRPLISCVFILIDRGISNMIHFCYIMKSKSNLLEQLKSLPHFSKNTVYQLGKQLGLKDATVNVYISRFLKYKDIIQLKRGLYVSADFFDKNRNDVSYPFYLANIIRTPSYISSWAALQYYNSPPRQSTPSLRSRLKWQKNIRKSR